MKKHLRRIAGGITIVFALAFAYFASLATVSQHNTDEAEWALDCLYVAVVSFLWLLMSEGTRARGRSHNNE
ncbi:MAG: hypothetical protein AB1704_20405 [Pseudomonadota bacterium]